jgi:hypothetical protein
MRFSVIYSVDLPRDLPVHRVAPPGRMWELTEHGKTQMSEVFPKGKHRKWCAILNRRQFNRFVEVTDLSADSTETMGSIGAPGFGIGWAPAISFNSEDTDCYQNAYVTPVPSRFVRKSGKPLTERDWERIRKAVVKIYG